MDFYRNSPYRLPNMDLAGWFWRPYEHRYVFCNPELEGPLAGGLFHLRGRVRRTINFLEPDVNGECHFDIELDREDGASADLLDDIVGAFPVASANLTVCSSGSSEYRRITVDSSSYMVWYMYDGEQDHLHARDVCMKCDEMMHDARDVLLLCTVEQSVYAEPKGVIICAVAILAMDYRQDHPPHVTPPKAIVRPQSKAK